MKIIRYEPKMPLKSLKVSSKNVRKTEVEKDIEGLVESVRKYGILQPLLVSKDNDDMFEVIVGQRRFKAAEMLELEYLPCLEVEVEPTDSKIVSFSENLHRRELDYNDKMTAAIELMNEMNNDKEKVAKALGITVTTLKSYLGWKDVPEEVRQMVADGFPRPQAIRISHALEDVNKIIALAKRVAEILEPKIRKKVISEAIENPELPVEDIVKGGMAKSMAEINVSFPQNISQALNSASEKYEQEKEDIVVQAVEEWLRGRGFLAK